MSAASNRSHPPYARSPPHSRRGSRGTAPRSRTSRCAPVRAPTGGRAPPRRPPRPDGPGCAPAAWSRCDRALPGTARGWARGPRGTSRVPPPGRGSGGAFECNGGRRRSDPVDPPVPVGRPTQAPGPSDSRKSAPAPTQPHGRSSRDRHQARAGHRGGPHRTTIAAGGRRRRGRRGSLHRAGTRAATRADGLTGVDPTADGPADAGGRRAAPVQPGDLRRHCGNRRGDPQEGARRVARRPAVPLGVARCREPCRDLHDPATEQLPERGRARQRRGAARSPSSTTPRSSGRSTPNASCTR